MLIIYIENICFGKNSINRINDNECIETQSNSFDYSETEVLAFKSAAILNFALLCPLNFMYEKFVPIKAIKIAQLTNKAFFKVMFWRRIKLSIFDFFLSKQITYTHSISI